MANSASKTYDWRETRPGQWERAIDEVEQFYTNLAKSYEASGRTFFAITGFVSLSVPLTGNISIQEGERRLETSLQHAWVRLRYDHPTIASWVQYDPESRTCKKIYQALDNATESRGLKEWLHSTFRTVSTDSTGLEWCNSDPPVPQLPTIFVIKTNVTSNGQDDRTIRRDIVLRSPHDIIDGIGTLHLLNHLLTHASTAYSQQSSAYEQPAFGSEWKNLSPPLRVAAEIPESLTATQKTLFEKTLALNASLRDGVQIAGIPYNNQGGANLLPGKHQRVALALDAERTARLLAACRKLGVTPTHAYHAAIALRVRDVQERKEKESTARYINYCLINERSHCVEPYNTPRHAVAVYHSVSGGSLTVDLKVPSLSSDEGNIEGESKKEEFIGVVTHIKKFYQQIREDKEHISMVPSYWTLGTPAVDFESIAKDGPPPVPAPNKTPTVSISSMGVIDHIISPKKGLFEIDNPWVTGEELNSGLGLFLGTFKGQLNLSAAFNEAWHDQDEVLGFLKGCEDVVFQGLEI